MSKEELINAPIEFTLGDLPLKLRRLSDADLTELDLWVRSQVMAIAETGIDDDMPAQRQAAIREAAMSKAMRTSWMSGDGRAMMSSPDGLARIVYQACSKSAPYAEIKKRLFVPENITTVKEVIEQLNPKVPNSVRVGKPKAKSHPGASRKRKKRTKGS